MNALTTIAPEQKEDLIQVLQNSLYPGAKRESIELVLSYCRVNSIDPLLKPVHIVPTSVKVGQGQWETRDVLMPGISDYRIKAARSGEYGGKTEPEFGPDQTKKLGDVTVTFPAWCKVTISRIVHGQAREFVAKEYWLENYATAGRNTDAPNAMWRKRPYGQLAKCAEAQALRMAFPEFSGGAPTAEEMEGKELFTGTTIDAKATIEQPAASRREAINAEVPIDKPKAQKLTISQWLDSIEIALRDAGDDADAINRVLDRQELLEAPNLLKGAALERFLAMRDAARQKAAPFPPLEDEDELPEVEIQGADKVLAGD